MSQAGREARGDVVEKACVSRRSTLEQVEAQRNPPVSLQERASSYGVCRLPWIEAVRGIVVVHAGQSG